MFENSVFKVSVDTKKWIKASLVRAVKTMAQTTIATIGVATTIGSVDWKIVLSTAALSGILSLLTSIAGIPEVKANEDIKTE